MFRNAARVAVYVAVLLVTAASTQAAQYGTAEEAKSMLDRAVAVVKEDKDEGTRHVQQGRQRL
jgi:hypothetical protein